jgi:glycosyltransferase involved in cell wall biosynthesis
VPAYVDEVVIVSNRSRDDTVEVARSLGAVVEVDDRTHHGNGYGYGVMSALGLATSDLLVTADSDGTYPFESIEGAVNHLVDHNLDYVSCNRYPLADKHQVPFKLRVGVGLLNLEVRLLYGVAVRDVISGMNVIRREVVPTLGLNMGDWNGCPELRLKAFLDPDVAAEEYRIVQRDRFGTSHQAYFRTGFSHAWWLLRYRFGDRRGTTPDPPWTPPAPVRESGSVDQHVEE